MQKILKVLNQKKKYEESITERIKTRRQNTRRTFAPSSPPKNDYSEATANYTKYEEEEEEEKRGQKRFSDGYDSNGWSSGSGLNKKGSGLKILTNKQMLNRLPILLAQIQVGNNSKSLKNEIRQILYSLYRSKVLTKIVSNNLIKSIRA